MHNVCVGQNKTFQNSNSRVWVKKELHILSIRTRVNTISTCVNIDGAAICLGNASTFTQSLADWNNFARFPIY